MTLNCSGHAVLLHVCCAPCCTAVIERLVDEGSHPSVFFYNPNIAPRKEYLLRKDTLVNYLLNKDLPFIDADYDHALWLEKTRGLEAEPERGLRCTACFDVRLERTARYARENGFTFFATTNGVSRWKNLDQVNASGLKAAMAYPGLHFLARNWREKDAHQLMARIVRNEKLYQQKYCGCEFSARPYARNGTLDIS